MTLKEIEDKAKKIENTWKSKHRTAQNGLLNRGTHISIPLADRIQEADQVFLLVVLIDDLVKLVNHRRKRMRHFLDTSGTYDELSARFENEVTEWEKADRGEDLSHT